MFLAIYNLVLHFALPFIYLRLWLRGKKLPAYRERWLERLGIFQPPEFTQPIIWIHAVSVGETIAALPLANELLNRNFNLIITNATPTGSERVNQAFGNDNRVFNVYVPYDLPFCIKQFFKRVQPSCAIFMETEIWPNTLCIGNKLGIPLILANARMSEKSARGYGRFKKTSARLLNTFSTVAAQNAQDSDRFKALGLQSNKIEITGSIKFDIQTPYSLRQEAKSLKEIYSSNGKHVLWIAASTHAGEEEIILTCHKELLQQHPNLRLILVPRHPDRFKEITQLAQSQFKTVCRSSKQDPTEETQVIIGDTMGEMMLLYGCSDIAFVGGSLIKRGGHNMIEPAVWGLPILTGPHTFNFADIGQKLEQQNGLSIINDGTELTRKLGVWLKDKKTRETFGVNAKKFAEENRGALDRLLEVIERNLKTRH